MAGPTPPDHLSLAGLRVLVVGLGSFGGGLGVTKWLARSGARVTVTDRASAGGLSASLAALDGLSIDFKLGGHDGIDLGAVDLAVISPAIPTRAHVLFSEITRRGIPWTTEINLFCGRCAARVVAVTGSFGKSTTSSMVATIVSDAARRGRGKPREVFLGGNIGKSLLCDLERIGGQDLVVLELSDTQLEHLSRISWSPEVAVITNLVPHHLDRYASFSDYIQAKLGILGNAEGRSPRVVVGSLDDRAAKMLHERAAAKGLKVLAVADSGSPVALSVPGEHNQRNARYAVAAAEALGISADDAREALGHYRGLRHRLEEVHTVGGVRFVNDSKSTAPEATVVAVSAFDCPVTVIVGGRTAADARLGAFARVLALRCKAVVGTGESGGRMVEAIARAKVAGGVVSLRVADSVEEACLVAQAAARPGEAVVFSPGAPSFDAYANYRERGDHFVDVVRALGKL